MTKPTAPSPAGDERERRQKPLLVAERHWLIDLQAGVEMRELCPGVFRGAPPISTAVR
jgi:hypothetical protein